VKESYDTEMDTTMNCVYVCVCVRARERADCVRVAEERVTC
jgi:hypothetical protein